MKEEPAKSPNAKEVFWEKMAPIIPMLIKANAFLPEILDYSPFPASIAAKLKQQLTSRMAAAAIAAAGGAGRKGSARSAGRGDAEDRGGGTGAGAGARDRQPVASRALARLAAAGREPKPQAPSPEREGKIELAGLVTQGVRMYPDSVVRETKKIREDVT